MARPSWSSGLGERADATRYRAHTGAGQYLLGEVVYATADVVNQLGLAEATSIDGYLTAGHVDGLVSRHGLTRDDEGRVTLRATTRISMSCVTWLTEALCSPRLT